MGVRGDDDLGIRDRASDRGGAVSSKRQEEEVAAFQARLNEYGAAAWEMIGFETVPLTGSFSGNIKGYIYLAFFKRPKP